MTNYRGWIKGYRKLLDNPLIFKPFYCHIWHILLLLAQHEKTHFIWANTKWTLEEGQLMTGRKKLSELSGISESQIERILKYLENEQQITQIKTTKFRIITIVNWEKYQGSDGDDTTSEQQKDSNGTTEGQQKDTYKNDKNDKNDKKSKYSQDFEKFWESYPKRKSKGQALKTWDKLQKEKVLPELSVLLSAVAAAKAGQDWQRDGGQYIPYPSTWLNASGWLDEPVQVVNKTSETLKRFREAEERGEKI